MTVYFIRHGQSEANVRERIGGDAALSPAGRVYARELGQFLAREFADDLPRQEEHCVLLRMTTPDYAFYLDVMTAYGATRRGRGLAEKETALRAVLTAAMAARNQK